MGSNLAKRPLKWAKVADKDAKNCSSNFNGLYLLRPCDPYILYRVLY